MTPEAAFFQFMNSFGMTSYVERSVPDDATLPYATYALPVAGWGDGEVAVAVHLWHRTTSEAVVNASVRALMAAVPLGGRQVQCDGGAMLVRRGTPFAQPAGESAGVKDQYVNLSVEYLVAE